jgi:hypothetical protein
MTRKALSDIEQRIHSREARHYREWQSPHSRFVKALKQMIEGWEAYAAAHQKTYESPIGEDGVIGEYWRQIGQGLRGLLDGDTGSEIDCGTLEHSLRSTMKLNAVDPDDQS